MSKQRLKHYPCHSGPREQWCDRDGPGGFMGHTCEHRAETVDHPRHYNVHPSGVECIAIIEHMPHNIGAAMKYLWRCDEKHPDAVEDLRKAEWYVRREIERRQKLAGGKPCA